MELGSTNNGEFSTLVLETLGEQNYFAGQTLTLYREALAAHEEGRELAEYIRSIKLSDGPSRWDKVHLGDDQSYVDFVLGASESEPDDEGEVTHYNRRLGFLIQDGWDSSSSLLRALRNEMTTLTDRYEAYTTKKLETRASMCGKDQGDSLGSILVIERADRDHGFERIGRDKAGMDLDGNFNQAGQRLGQLDRINFQMVRLGLLLNNPEVALHFVDQLVSKKALVDVYSESLLTTGPVHALVQERLARFTKHARR